MFRKILFVLALVTNSSIAMASTKFCSGTIATIGTVSSDQKKLFRKLLRFNLEEQDLLVDDSTECEFQTNAIIINTDDKSQIVIRVMSDGVRQVSFSQDMDDASDMLEATRIATKQLAKWAETGEDAEGDSTPTLSRISYQPKDISLTASKVVAPRLPDSAFEIGLGVGSFDAEVVNFTEHLQQSGFFIRKNEGRLGLRLEALYLKSNESDYQIPDAWVGQIYSAGVDWFWLSTAVTPYLGFSGNYTQLMFPSGEESSDFGLAERNEEKIADAYLYEGFSGSARFGVAFFRTSSSRVRLSYEITVHAVPNHEVHSVGGVYGSQLNLTLVPFR